MVADLRMAGDIGIDAFQFDLTSIRADSSMRRFENMLAATLVENRVKCVPCLDCYSLAIQKEDPAYFASWLKIKAEAGGLLRLDSGEVVLSAFAPENAGEGYWQRIFREIKAIDLRIAFNPMFLDEKKSFMAPRDIPQISGLWGGSSLGESTLTGLIADGERLRGASWCAPVWPQNCRPKDFWYQEAGNSRLFREDWTQAIKSHADWVALLTWNDYSEGSEVRPSVDNGIAFYGLAKYFIRWFKTGRLPVLTTDVLYYFHRTQFSNGSQTLAKQTSSYKLRGDNSIDEIELVALLTKPSVISIEIAGKKVAATGGPGLLNLTIPLEEGLPLFKIVRSEGVVAQILSEFQIVRIADYQDLRYKSGGTALPSFQEA